jgi:hypothetical protein
MVNSLSTKHTHLPTVTRPTNLQPAIDVCTTGIWSANSDSKTLLSVCEQLQVQGKMLVGNTKLKERVSHVSHSDKDKHAKDCTS